jgi:hypothetical protein
VAAPEPDWRFDLKVAPLTSHLRRSRAPFWSTAPTSASRPAGRNASSDLRRRAVSQADDGDGRHTRPARTVSHRISGNPLSRRSGGHSVSHRSSGHSLSIARGGRAMRGRSSPSTRRWRAYGLQPPARNTLQKRPVGADIRPITPIHEPTPQIPYDHPILPQSRRGAASRATRLGVRLRRPAASEEGCAPCRVR